MRVAGEILARSASPTRAAPRFRGQVVTVRRARASRTAPPPVSPAGGAFPERRAHGPPAVSRDGRSSTLPVLRTGRSLRGGGVLRADRRIGAEVDRVPQRPLARRPA